MRNQILARDAAREWSRKTGRNIMTAEIGNNQGDTVVAVGSDRVWVMLHGDRNQPVRAINKGGVPTTAGIIVFVEYVKTTGVATYQILSRANATYPVDPWENTVGVHGAQHERRNFGAGGFDPVNTWTRMSPELRARQQATPDMTVYVEVGNYPMFGAEVVWSGGNSPTVTVPANPGESRCDLLYLDPANVLTFANGTAAVVADPLTSAKPTNPTGGYFPIAYIYTTNAQTTITEYNISDARLHFVGAGTSTLGALTAKNPPIDADKVVYQDSTAGDALVTSTWTQVKAFLKTYFDTLYGGLTAFLKLDQTTHQHIINGRPVFDDGLTLGVTPTIGAGEPGKITWDATYGFPNVELTATTGVKLGLGGAIPIIAGENLAAGDAVYISGGSGVYPVVMKAKADAELTSRVKGFVMNTTLLNANGYVKQFGFVENLNTNSWNVGDIIYLSGATAGAITNVQPVAPLIQTVVGRVVVKSATVGSLWRSPSPNYPLSADHVDLHRVAGSTYHSLTDWFNAGSCGQITGGTIADAGSQKITVSAGTGMIAIGTSANDPIVWCDWAGLAATTVTDLRITWVCVSYAAGTPAIVLYTGTSASDYAEPAAITYQDVFPLGYVVRQGTHLLVTKNPRRIQDSIGGLIRRTHQTTPLARDERVGGLILGEGGTRNITLSTGYLWERQNRFLIAAINTAGADRFSSWIRDGAGGFTETTGVAQWDNINYDNNAGVVTALGVNKYANLWWYLDTEGHVDMVYGRFEYANAAAAALGAVPATLPLHINAQSRLIARTTFQKSAATFVAIDTIFTNTFTSSAASAHNNLSNLGWTVSGHTGTASRVAAFAAVTGAASELEMTGTGKVVMDTSPVLVTPALGTPSSGVLTSCTGLPLAGLATQASDTIVANITGGAAVPTAVALAANQFLAKSSAGNIAAKTLTDFALTILDDANAATVRATIGAGTGSGDALVGNPLSQFAATTSAQLAGVISDETGTGALVFGTAPLFKTTINLNNPANTFKYIITPAAIAADRILNVPLLLATDTIAVLDAIQTFTNKTLTTPTIVGNITMADGATIGQATGPLVAFDDTNNYLEITGCNVGIGTVAPISVTELSNPGVNYWTYATNNWNGSLIPTAALTITNSSTGGYDPVLIGRMTTSTGVSKPAFAIGAVGTGPWTEGDLSLQIARMYFVLRDGAGALRERISINSAGNVGFGVTAPQGKIHGLGANSVGSFMHWDGTTPDSTATVNILATTNLVLYHISVMGVVRNSGGTSTYFNSGCAINANFTVTIGGNGLVFAVSAGGAVTVARNAGTGTWTVSIWMCYL